MSKLNLYQQMAAAGNNNVAAIKQVHETFTVLFDAQTAAIHLVREAVRSSAYLSMSDRAALAKLMEDLIVQRSELVVSGLVTEDVITSRFPQAMKEEKVG